MDSFCRVNDDGIIPVKETGKYPLPSECVRFVEPDWNLHGLIQDPECEEQFEKRMIEAEELKVLPFHSWLCLHN
jgi:hypothetical protein